LYGISPNSDYVLYSEQGNLSLLDLHNNQTVTLTDNAVEDSVSNSRAVWSPDGKRITFVESDVSDVRLRQMLGPGDPSYPEVRKVRFARVGGTIASLRVGVVDVQGTAIRWLSIPRPPEGFYIEHLGWAANSHEVLVEKSSRFRDEREFLIADIRTGAVTCIYHEADPAWVLASYRVNAGLEWIRGGSAFVLLSEQDGWRHAYAIQRNSGEKVLLTPGASDIIRRERVDEAGGWFYYLASPDNATQRYLYRVRLDGKGTPEKITPSDQPGTHEYTFSPNAKWAFHTYSTFDTPPVTELIRLPEHKAVRVLEDNQELQDRVDSWSTHPVEFLQLDIGDDVVLDAYMIKPRAFDPSNKYPVISSFPLTAGGRRPRRGPPGGERYSPASARYPLRNRQRDCRYLDVPGRMSICPGSVFGAGAAADPTPLTPCSGSQKSITWGSPWPLSRSLISTMPGSRRSICGPVR
jgi:dipeptidyl-peptidase-4